MLKSVLNSKLLSIGAASIIAVGVIGAASVAMADEPAAPGAQEAGARHGKRPGAGIVIAKVLKDSGVTKEEVQQGASEDKTFGEIITAYGDKSVEQSKTDSLAALDARLTEAVANGRITQEKADELEAAAPAAFDKLMAAKPGDHEPRHPKLAAVGKHALETVAETLGIETSDLVAQIRGGATINEIAGDQADEVEAALIAEANAAIDKAVGEGKISAEKGEEAKSKTAERVEKFMNSDHPGRGPKGPGGPRGN